MPPGLAAAAIAVSLAACSSSSAPSAADQAACGIVHNIQALDSAGKGGPVFTPGAIYATLMMRAGGTSQSLRRDLSAAARANSLGVTNLVPGSLNAAGHDCSVLGIKP